MQIDTAWRTVWSFHMTPGHVPGESSNLKRYMHPEVHSSTIYSTQGMEAA